MTSDLGAHAPKYHRVANELRTDIGAGRYGAGDRLPAETTLADRFGVSVPTVRQAMALLRAEGVVESQHGIGTFVKNTQRMRRYSRGRYGRARADRQLLTAHLRHEIVAAGREVLPSHVADAMGVPAGTEAVVRRRRLYNRDSGVLEEIGASYLPVDIAGGSYLEEADVVPQALFLCVEGLSGQTYAHAEDLWTSRLPTTDESTVLALATGAPVLHVVHTARAEDGTVLEVSESIWPADRVVIVDSYPIDSDTGQPISDSQI